MRGQCTIFVWAPLSTSLGTGLPRQKHHAFQAQAMVFCCFSGVYFLASAGLH